MNYIALYGDPLLGEGYDIPFALPASEWLEMVKDGRGDGIQSYGVFRNHKEAIRAAMDAAKRSTNASYSGDYMEQLPNGSYIIKTVSYDDFRQREEGESVEEYESAFYDFAYWVYENIHNELELGETPTSYDEYCGGDDE